MPRSLTNLLIHAIFSTKDRAPMIRPEFQDNLFRYMGGIVRQIGGKALIVGGTADHVHILLELRPTHRAGSIGSTREDSLGRPDMAHSVLVVRTSRRSPNISPNNNNTTPEWISSKNIFSS